MIDLQAMASTQLLERYRDLALLVARAQARGETDEEHARELDLVEQQISRRMAW